MAKLALTFTSQSRNGTIFDEQGVIMVTIGYTMIPIPQNNGIEPKLFAVYQDEDGLFIDLTTHYVSVEPLFPDRYAKHPEHRRYFISKGQFVLID